MGLRGLRIPDRPATTGGKTAQIADPNAVGKRDRAIASLADKVGDVALTVAKWKKKANKNWICPDGRFRSCL